MNKFLFVLLVAVVGVAMCDPVPDAKADPDLLAYTAPIVKTLPTTSYLTYPYNSPYYRSSLYYGNYNYATYPYGYAYATPYQYQQYQYVY